MLASVFASSSSPSPAQSCFSFAVRSPLATFLRALPPLRQQKEEEVYASPVQSVSAWRKQAKAEASAGIEQSGQVLTSLYPCDICGIHIGPGFYEQELFLWPLRNTTITRDKPVHYSAAILYACGGCARRRHLPEWSRVIQPAHWETTMLLCEQEEQECRPTQRTQLGEMKRVYTAIRQLVVSFATLLTTLSILSLGFSLQLFRPQVTEKKEMALLQQQSHPLSAPSPKGQLLSFNRSLNTTSTLATFLRTLPPQERNVLYA